MRPWSIGIVGVWVMLLSVLAYRTWPTAPQAAPVRDALQPAAGEEWMGAFHQGAKIGYTHHRLASTADGFTFSEESLLRLTVLQAPQIIHATVLGHTDSNFALRDVRFQLQSGVGNLHATAVVEGAALHLTLRTGHETSEQTLPLTEPIYLPSTLRESVRAGGFAAGQTREALIFDPMSLKNERIRATVESFEAVPENNEAVRAWRVREELGGLTTTAWIDSTGRVLREEGPMGLVLVRQSADQALTEDWASDTALDLVAQAAVPVAQPIDDARERRRLRVRLSGIAVENIPSDGEQVRDGAVLTITRPRVADVESYPLPYTGAEHAADLAPTTFLQSTHPRLQAAAREAVGDERDAKRAAMRLNNWVYEHLRKVPTISLPNALQVLDMGEGDCNEHAVLLAAMGRAVGLPTRVIAGAVYIDGAFLYHAWCEVWLGRWVSIDPALHQFPADATHLKLVVGGPDDQVAMLGIIGRLSVDVLSDEPASSG